ncbi:MAG TPA: glycosyl hydrolase family 18 protein, partial [Niabella sp.]|nr:glycosyl hydrolase family 18 protein [Niabella sp.]
MKHLSATFLLLLAFIGCWAQKQKKQVVVAYVTSGSKVMPDPDYVTHINYAFGHINKTFDGIEIENPGRLRSIVNLKNKNRHLKVLLSIGGWGSGGFSEMAAHADRRKRFADSCARLIGQYHLDGIDVDWEYPTSNIAGITAAKEDTGNYTMLMTAIRKAIGPGKLLTLASVDNARFVDFKSIKDI